MQRWHCDLFVAGCALTPGSKHRPTSECNVRLSHLMETATTFSSRLDLFFHLKLIRIAGGGVSSTLLNIMGSWWLLASPLAMIILFFFLCLWLARIFCSIFRSSFLHLCFFDNFSCLNITVNCVYYNGTYGPADNKAQM